MVPLNLLSQGQSGGYFVTGVWSQMAFEEAKRLRSAYCIASAAAEGFVRVPDPLLWQIQDDTAYLYYAENETVNGVRFPTPPQMGQNLPLVVDMTSSLLSETLTVSDYGLIFAGSQKNIAPAGMTVVIVRADLLQHLPELPIPTMLDYRVHAQHHSLYATPPTFCCYMAYKMFVAQAEQAGLYALKGHKLVGGIRASIYNAMPMAGVDALLNFMIDFSKVHR